MRTLKLYIAASMDGYIAKPGDDLSFLSVVQKEGEDYGYHDFIKTVDTVILGRKTYDWILRHEAFPHKDKNAYIITRTPRPSEGNTVFYTGSLPELVSKLKGQPGKNIFCDGGAEVIHELLKHHLIDEMIISVIPVLTGGGTRLFKDGRPEEGLTLLGAKSFDTGLVQLHYKCHQAVAPAEQA